MKAVRVRVGAVRVLVVVEKSGCGPSGGGPGRGDLGLGAPGPDEVGPGEAAPGGSSPGGGQNFALFISSPDPSFVLFLFFWTHRPPAQSDRVFTKCPEPICVL